MKINAIEVPEGSGPELECRFEARHGSVDSAPGFLGFELLRPVVAGDNKYFVCTKWETEEHFQAWRNGPAMEAHFGGHCCVDGKRVQLIGVAPWSDGEVNIHVPGRGHAGIPPCWDVGG